MSAPEPPVETPSVPSRRKHSEKFKAKAILLADKIGARKAAAKLGISDALIYTWRKRAAAPVALVHRNGNGVVSHQESPDDVLKLDFPTGYAVGRIEAQLEGYAGRIQVPPATFTARVARLLLRSSRGQVLGA